MKRKPEPDLRARLRGGAGMVLFFLIMAVKSIGAEDFSTWAHTARIRINTTATGAFVAKDILKFPLLIRLPKADPDNPNVMSQSLADGADIRFADPDGTPLDFQMERWDPQTGAEFWVLVPQINGNSDKDYIDIHWGKAGAPALSDGTKVFLRSMSYEGVWHLGEPITQTRKNSVGAFNHASPKNYKGPERVNGVIGMADSLIGVTNQGDTYWGGGGPWVGTPGPAPALGSYLDVGSGFAGLSRGFTFTVWVKTGNNGNNARFMDFGNGPAMDNVILSRRDDPNALYYQAYNAAKSGISGSAKQGFAENAWTLIGVTQEADNVGLYKNGMLLQTFKSTVVLRDVIRTHNFLGHSNWALDADYTGSLDEPEISLIVRSADWMKLNYESQRPDGKLLAWETNDAPVDTITRVAPGGSGDSLVTGNSLKLDSTHSLVYPAQEALAPVRVSIASAWDPAPSGFDHLGPLFTVTAADSLAAFPGLAVAGDTVAGVQLYRREGESNRWIPPNGGDLWIPSAGAYFWGRDTLPPRIRYAGTDVLGADSLFALFVLEDNVINLRCRLRVRNGGEAEPDWRSADKGEMLRFPIRLPASPHIPLELNLIATDERNSTSFPSAPGRDYTVPRRLESVAAPLELASGHAWKLTGMPFEPESPLTLPDLAAASGSGGLVGAYWKTRSGAEGDYVTFASDDTLPVGKGFWIAAGQATRVMAFPPARALASDSDGLFAVPLRSGWNLVTCPSFRPLAWPVSPRDGEAYLRSSLKGLRGYDGAGYTRPDSLRPFEGYYVWYGGGDTVVHVGPGLPRASDPAAKRGSIGGSNGGSDCGFNCGNKDGVDVGVKNSASASAGGAGIRLALSGSDDAAAPSLASVPAPHHATRLEIGAAGFARSGLGNEDELQPPALAGAASGQAWITRAGRALSTDYVPWEPDRAMAWTLIIHSVHSVPSGQSAPGNLQGYRFDIESAFLPEGYQAWAVSPSRRVKYRLSPGGTLPVTGEDTLSVYAGTPEALAKVADLINGRDVHDLALDGFACSLRNSPGGLELALDLPTAATVDLRLWSPTGSQTGGVRGLRLAPGRHVWSGSTLSTGGFLSQGVYLLEIRAQGVDWSARQVKKFGALR